MAYDNIQNTPEQLSFSQRLRSQAYQNYISANDSVVSENANTTTDASGVSSTGFSRLSGRQQNFREPFEVMPTGATDETLEGYKESGFGNNVLNSLRDIMSDINRVSGDATKGRIVRVLQPGIRNAQRGIEALDKINEVNSSITRIRAAINNSQDPATAQQLIERLDAYKSELAQLEKQIPDGYGYSRDLSDFSEVRNNLTNAVTDYSDQLKEAYEDIATDEEDVEDWKSMLGDTDPYWKKMREDNPNFHFSDAASWSNVPSTVGSSSSAWWWQISPYVTTGLLALGKKWAAKAAAGAAIGAATAGVPTAGAGAVPGAAIGGTIGTILTIGDVVNFGNSLYSAYKQGENEANAEVFSNYRSRVSNAYSAQGGDINNIIASVKENADNKDIIRDKSDDQILDMVMDGRIQYSDELFDKVTTDAQQSTTSLFQQNLAITTAGNILSNALYLPTFSRVLGATGKVATAAGKVTRNTSAIFDPVTWGLGKGLTAASKASSKYLLRRNAVDAATKAAKVARFAARYAAIPLGLAAKRGIEMISEFGEEGAQYISGKQYQTGKFDEELSTIGGALRDYAQGFSNRMEVYGMATGLYNNPLYTSDAEFWNNAKLGAAAALVSLPSAISIPTDIIGARQDRMGVNFVSRLATDELAAKETLQKVHLYGSIKNQSTQQSVLRALTLLSETNSLPEGLTKEGVQEEVKLANEVFATMDSNRIKHLAAQLGIAENSADYNDLITLAIDAKRGVDKARISSAANRAALTNVVNKVLLDNADVVNNLTANIDSNIAGRDYSSALVDILLEEVETELQDDINSTLGLFDENSKVTDNRILGGNKYAKAQLADFNTRLNAYNAKIAEDNSKKNDSLKKFVEQFRNTVDSESVDAIKSAIRYSEIAALQHAQAQETYRAFYNQGDVKSTLAQNLAEQNIRNISPNRKVRKSGLRAIEQEYATNGNALAQLLYHLHKETKSNSKADLENLSPTTPTQETPVVNGEKRTVDPKQDDPKNSSQPTPTTPESSSSPVTPEPENADQLGNTDTSAYGGKSPRKKTRAFPGAQPVVPEPATPEQESPKSKRGGRPKGSKNRPKVNPENVASLTEEQIRTMVDDEDGGVMPTPTTPEKIATDTAKENSDAINAQAEDNTPTNEVPAQTKPKVSEETKQELRDAWKEVLDVINRSKNSNFAYNPEQDAQNQIDFAIAALKLVKVAFKYGSTRFGEMVRNISNDIFNGDILALETYFEELKRVYTTAYAYVGEEFKRSMTAPEVVNDMELFNVFSPETDELSEEDKKALQDNGQTVDNELNPNEGGDVNTSSLLRFDPTKGNGILHTFHYQPDAKKAQKSIKINGKTIKFSPNSELPDVLRNSGEYLETQYAVTGDKTVNWADQDTWDNADVHTIIHDPKTGKYYLTTMKRANASDFEFMGLDERAERIPQLREIRNAIISEFVADGKLNTKKVVRPAKVVFHQAVKGVVDEYGAPVYRNIMDLHGDVLRLSEDLDVEIENFAYGVGVRSKDFRNSVVYMDGIEVIVPTEDGGATQLTSFGSGTIYYIIHPEKRPSGRLLDLQLRMLPYVGNEELAYQLAEIFLRSGMEGQAAKFANTELLLLDIISMFLNHGPHTLFNPNDERLAEYDKAIEQSPEQRQHVSELKERFINNMQARQLFIGEQNGVMVLVFGNNTIPASNISSENLSEVVSALANYIQNNLSFPFTIPASFARQLESNPREAAFGVNNESYSLTMEDLFEGRLKAAIEEGGGSVRLPGGFEIKASDLNKSPLTWMMKSGLIQTDLDEQAYLAPYVIAEGISSSVQASSEQVVQEQATPQESVSERPETTQNEKIAAANALFEDFDAASAEFTQDSANESISDAPIHQERGQYLKDKLGLTDDEVNIVDVGISAENAESAVSHMLLDSITLVTSDPISAEYHEAFHRVSLLLLPKSSKQKVYDTFRRKNPDLAHLTDKQIEEKLAEQFRFYVMNRTTKSFYGITKWFDTLVGFIDVLRGGANINYLFSKIHAGKFAGIPVNPESAAAFVEAYGDRANFTQDDVEYKHVATLDSYNQAVNFFTMTLVRKMWEANQNIEDITKFSIDYGYVRDSLDGLLAGDRLTAPQKAAIREISNNFDQFQAAISTQLQALGLNEIYKEAAEQVEEDIDSGNITKEGLDKYDLVDYEIDKAKTIRPVVKMLLSSLVVGGSTAINQNTGLPMTPSFDEVWKKLTNELYSADTWGELLRLTQMIAETNGDPLFQAVNRRLKSIKNVNVQTQMFQQLTGHRHDFLTVGFTNKGGWRNPSYDVIINGMIEDKNAKRTASLWNANFDSSGAVVIDENGKQVYDTDLLNAWQKEFINIRSAINKLRNETSTNEDVNIVIQSLSDFLNKIGIKVDFETINAVILDQLAAVDGVKNPKQKNKIFAFKRAFASRTTTTPGAAIDRILNKTKKDVVEDNFKRESGLLSLSYAYNRLYLDLSQETTYGPKNTSLYPLAKHNYITAEFKRLNKDRSYVRRLLEVATNQGSIVLKALSKDPNLQLKVHTLINIVEWYSGNSGVDYQHASDLETVIAKFALSENDFLLLPTMADKKKYQPISGLKLFGKDAIFYTKNEDGKIVANINQNVLDIFYEYYVSEYNAVAEYHSIKEREANVSDSNRVKAYIGERGKDGNGAKFRVAKGYYDSTGIYHDFNSMSWDEISSYFKNKGQVIADIENLLRKEIDLELSRFLEMGILTKSKAGLHKNVLLPKPSIDARVKNNKKAFKLMDDEVTPAVILDASIYDAVAGFTINGLISMVEAEKIIFKDPAYYKNFDDLIKRLGGALSTGDRARTDFSPDSWFSKIPRYAKGLFKVVGIKDIMTRERQAADIYDVVYRAYVNEYLETDTTFTPEEIKSIIYQDDLYMRMLEEYDAYNKISDKESLTERAKFLKQVHEKAKKQTEADLTLYGNIKRDENGFLDLKEYYDGKKNAPVNQADGSVYVSPQMYKAILYTQGELTREVEEAIDYIEAHPEATGDKATYIKAMGAVMRPRKMVYYGNDIIEPVSGIKLNVPIFNKMAIFPLFKATATGDLRAMYDRMVDPNDPIDMVTTTSAVKVGNITEYDFYETVEQDELSTSFKKDEFGNYPKLASRMQFWDNLFNQMPIEPHEEERRMLVTQAMKNVYSNIRLDGEYFLPNKQGERVTSVTGQQLANLAMKAINELSDRGLKQLLKQFDAQRDVDGNFLFRSFKGLSKKLQRDAQNSGMSSGIIAALGLNQEGEFNVPLSALSAGRQMIAKLISSVNKSVIDINLPGGSYVQMSSFGMKSGREDVLNTIDTSKLGYKINHGRRLRMKNEDGSMDAVITINAFKHMIPDYANKTFMESRQWLIDAGVIGHPEDRRDGSETITSSIGYRVPSQGPSSISSLKIRDVLPPNVGDLVILPDAFTARTGSDFDIDKLFFARYNFTEDGKKIQFKVPSDLSEESLDTAIKKASPKQLENLLLDTFFASLLDFKNAHDAFKPIDVPIEAMKDIAKTYYKGEVSSEPFAYYRASYQDRIKREFADSVDGIGPFALNLPQHVLSQMVQLTMDNLPEGYGYEELRNLHKTTGVDGIHITDWLSAMISAHVDVAKDNYIIRLNVNSYTYNVVNLLLRAGAGKNALFFVMQDIIRDLAKARINSNGRYGVGATTGGFKVAEQTIYNKYVTAATRLAKTSNQKRDLKELLESSEVNVSMLFEQATTDGITTLESSLTDEKNTFNYYYNQLYAYKMFDRLNSIGAAMSELVSATQIDTKKTGKNALQMRDFLIKVNEIKRNGAGYFKPEVIQKFFNTTFLQKKLENGTEFLLNLLAPVTISAKESYYELYRTLLRLANIKKLQTTYDQSAFTNALDGMWRAKAMYNEDATDLFEDLESVQEMFFGENTMARRLNVIKNKIREAAKSGKKAYPEVEIMFGKISNLFLNSLNGVTTSQQKSPEYISVNAGNDMTTDLAQQIRQYWLELIESSDPELSAFANDLVKYALFSGHGALHKNALFDFIPTQVLDRYGYYRRVREMEKMSEQEFFDMITEEDVDEIYRNNWQNDDLVQRFFPDVEIEGDTSYEPQLIEYHTSDFGKRKRVAVVPRRVQKIGENEDGIPVYPPFIKVSNPSAFGKNDLFKYIGTYITENKNGYNSYQPLYIIVNKKGYKETTKAYVTEYTSANIPQDASYNPRMSIIEANNVAPTAAIRNEDNKIVGYSVLEDIPAWVDKIINGVSKLPYVKASSFVKMDAIAEASYGIEFSERLSVPTENLGDNALMETKIEDMSSVETSTQDTEPLNIRELPEPTTDGLDLAGEELPTDIDSMDNSMFYNESEYSSEARKICKGN